jgi:ATP-dependent DNA helicase RecG
LQKRLDGIGADIIDRKEIEGSLFEIVEEVMKFVRLYSKVAYRFTGKPQRENIYEYPFDAVREAVINSVMHKYYFEHGHNNILRFLPDRIKIENYWQKPSNFVLGKTVFRRNHIIADLFSKIHFGEKMGTGFERIREICKKENSPFPDIEFNENYFYVTFKQSEEYLDIVKKGEKYEVTKLNKRQKMVLDHIEKTGRVTTKEYLEITKTTRRTAIRDLNDLVSKKILRVAGGKAGKQRYYVLM